MLPKVVEENWVQQLAFEVALEYFAPEDLQLKFQLDPADYEQVVHHDDFRRAVADYRREIDDEGIAFKLRARKAAEDMLMVMYQIAHDADQKGADRIAAAKAVCEYAGYAKPQEEAGGVKLQIITNLALGQADTGQTYTIQADS